MPLCSNLKQLFSEIDKNKEKYVDNLKEVVAIQSVSAWLHKRAELRKIVDWIQVRMQKLKIHVELQELGQQSFQDGKVADLPPVVFGLLGTDPKKKTVLIYGHLDVQPALVEDGWNSDPFVLTERLDKLYGRGASDDKGPVLCWLHAVEAYQHLGIDIPVNIKFVFEAMEESGSVGLKELLLSEKDKFLADVDYVCVSDTCWLGTNKPCVAYGLRGVCYFYIEVESATKDLHSGLFGGSVYEGMTDLIYMLNTLVDKDGRIKITGLYDEVAPLLPTEQEIYKNIDFGVDEYRTSTGCDLLVHNEQKELILMHRWRYPCLSIHGIEGAFSESGVKTVIPGKVIGKFSIRIVPNQKAKQIERYVLNYLEKKWKEYGSPNKMKVYMIDGIDPWTEDPSHPHYAAAVKATEHVYKIKPDFTREGGTIPVTLMLQEAVGKNILLLPVTAGDDGHHSQNEKIDMRNYIQGTKLLAAYLYELGKLD